MKPWLKVLLWIIVIGGIVGGSTYYAVNSKAQKDKNNLQSRIDDLNKKLTTAKKSLADAQAQTTTATATTPTTTPAATPAATPVAATSWKSYANTTYGFSLTLPNDSWKNYAVKEVTPTDKSATKYLYLCIPTTDKSWTDSCNSGQFGPVSIGVYTKAQWDAIKNDDTPESNSKIAENSNYVFTYSHSQALPSDFESTDLGLTSLEKSIKAN